MVASSNGLLISVQSLISKLLSDASPSVADTTSYELVPIEDTDVFSSAQLVSLDSRYEISDSLIQVFRKMFTFISYESKVMTDLSLNFGNLPMNVILWPQNRSGL